MNRQSRTVFRCLCQFICVIIYVINERVWRLFFFFQKKWSGPFLLLFWVKNYYILPLDKYRHFEMNISPHRCLTAKSWKHFTEENCTWFFHSDRSFSVLLLQDPFQKHDSFGKKSCSMEKFSRDSHFSALYVKCDASFSELHISLKKRGKKKRGKKKTARKGHKWNRSLLTINPVNSNSAKPVVQERCDSSYLSVN